MIQPQLVAGIAKHIAIGDSKAVIAEHVRQAGYSTEEFELAYNEALAQVPSIPSHVPPSNYSYPDEQISPEESVPVADSATPAQLGSVSGINPPPPQSAVIHQSSPSRYTSLLSPLSIGVVMVIVVFVAGAVAFMFSGLSPATFSISGLFGGAPYSEGQLIQHVAEGIAKVSASDYSLVVSATAEPLDSDVYLLPPHLDKALEYPYASLSMLPSDFTLEGAVTGAFSYGNKNPDSYTKVSGSYETPDFTMHVDLEVVLSKLQGIFLRVNRFPSVFMVDVTPVREQWLHVWDKPLDDTFDQWTESVAETDEIGEQFMTLLHRADTYEVFMLPTPPTKETLNGETVFKYTFTLNPDTLSEYLLETQEYFTEKYGREHILVDLTEEDIALISDPELIKYFNDHVQYELWARPNGIPVQFAIKNRIAIDNDVNYLSLYSDPDREKKFFLTMQRSNAEIYYTDNNGYRDFCPTIEERNYAEYTYRCADTAQAYALTLELEETFWCVDSTGYSGEGSIQGSETVCSDAPKKQPTPKPVPTADRQITTSLVFTLKNINNPAPVEIPNNALSREEIVKKVPFLSFLLEIGE